MIPIDHFHNALSPNVGTGAKMSQDVTHRPRVRVRPEMQFADFDVPTQQCDAPRCGDEQSENTLGLGWGNFHLFTSMDTPSTADRLGWRGNRDRMRIEGLVPSMSMILLANSMINAIND